MPRLIFDLDDDRRAKLERIRASHGLRSLADALRYLIEREGDDPGGVPVQPAPKPPSFSHGRSKTVVAPARRSAKAIDALPLASDLTFESRLKKR